LRKGEYHAFTGPIRTNDGNVVIEAGVLTDEQLSKMDYYVDGVQGKLPANK
jgi:simple sugar transport system substrate-binding protein